MAVAVIQPDGSMTNSADKLLGVTGWSVDRVYARRDRLAAQQLNDPAVLSAPSEEEMLAGILSTKLASPTGDPGVCIALPSMTGSRGRVE